MRKVELLPTQDSEAGYGPAIKQNELEVGHNIFSFLQSCIRYLAGNLEIKVFEKNLRQ